MSTRTDASERPQRLLRSPTNPTAAPRPAPSGATTSPDVSAQPRSAAKFDGAVRPIESIAVDLEGASPWRLAVIAGAVAVVVAVALFAGS